VRDSPYPIKGVEDWVCEIMQECLHDCAGRDAFGFVAQLKHEQGDEGPYRGGDLGSALSHSLSKQSF
jgi:hypothetical protein